MACKLCAGRSHARDLGGQVSPVDIFQGKLVLLSASAVPASGTLNHSAGLHSSPAAGSEGPRAAISCRWCQYTSGSPACPLPSRVGACLDIPPAKRNPMGDEGRTAHIRRFGGGKSESSPSQLTTVNSPGRSRPGSPCAWPPRPGHVSATLTANKRRSSVERRNPVL